MSEKIVVFDDGETWALAEGVLVCEVTDRQFRKLEEGEYPKNMGLEGTPVLKPAGVITKKDLTAAPMYKVFRGAVDPLAKSLKDDTWDLFEGEQLPLEVRSEAMRLGVRLAHAADGVVLHIEKDDELAPKGADDFDAVLAYLRTGGTVVKLPDGVDSKYSRFYVVACYRPIRKSRAKRA